MKLALVLPESKLSNTNLYTTDGIYIYSKFMSKMNMKMLTLNSDQSFVLAYIIKQTRGKFHTAA